MLLLKYLSFSSAVASNHSYLTEAYVSDHLVSSIHWLLRAHPSGVPLREFSSIFQVGTAGRLVDLHYDVNADTVLMLTVLMLT